MLMDFEEVKKDKLFDERLFGIANAMRKHSKEVAAPLNQESARLTTVFVSHGLLTADQCTAYLNSKLKNKQKFIKLPAELESFSLEGLNLSFNDSVTLAEKCLEAGVVPYQLAGDGIIWLAKECEDTEDNFNTYASIAYTLGYCVLGKKKKFKHNNVKYVIEPEFNRVFLKFCVDNGLPDLSDKIYKPNPSIMSIFYIIKGIVLEASDIYYDPKPQGIKVSYSIYGDWVEDDLVYLSTERSIQFLNEVLEKSGFRTSDRAKAKSVLDLSIKDLGEQGNKYNGRVNALRFDKKLNIDSICIRIVDRSKKAIPFSKLNLSQDKKVEIEKILHNNNGLILITGATGSGKTTTAMSTLDLIQLLFPYKRIETSECPVEQTIDRISQIDMERADLTYDEVAEAETRRMSPIMYVGEFNSARTVRFGVEAVIRNSLVISTMHTIDASIAPDRVRSLTWEDPNLFPQFLQVLRGVIHQFMFKEVCKECSEMVDIDKDDRITNDMIKVLQYYKYYDKKILMVKEHPNKDCPCCKGRGFLINKPIIVSEVYMVDDLERQKLQELDPAKIYDHIYEKLRFEGRTEVQDALTYLKQGRVDWLQIWNKMSLVNKISTAQFQGDEKYNKKVAEGIDFNQPEVGKDFHNM